jgi:predicted DNA-binding transcriptional regulator AlpA
MEILYLDYVPLTERLFMKKTLTLTELAEYIGKNKRTLHRMIADRRFPVESIRGTKPRLWAIEAIDSWRLNGGVLEE